MIANRVALRTCSLRNTFSRRVPRRNYASHDPDATTAAPPIASSSRKPLPFLIVGGIIGLPAMYYIIQAQSSLPSTKKSEHERAMDTKRVRKDTPPANSRISETQEDKDSTGEKSGASHPRLTNSNETYPTKLMKKDGVPETAKSHGTVDKGQA